MLRSNGNLAVTLLLLKSFDEGWEMAKQLHGYRMTVLIASVDTEALPEGGFLVTTRFSDDSWVSMRTDKGVVTERIDHYLPDQIDPMCFRYETLGDLENPEVAVPPTLNEPNI
ncbi:MAG: hypothetical protein Q7T86_16695 [Hyphomicrobiaceae bacterium]|nr:hypothetical protein [Hyphomicrobiaceae bacterium]